MLLDQVFQFLDKTPYQKIDNAISVRGDLVLTDMHVNAGDFVITVSDGKVTFSPAGPWEDADGEHHETPKDYPAPQLRKNSLICKLGDRWYQGGVFRGFIVKDSGYLYLRTNDRWTFDNSDQWKVTLFAINDIDTWISKGYKEEIMALGSGDGQLKKEFSDLIRELSKEVKNQELRNNLYSFSTDIVRSLFYS